LFKSYLRAVAKGEVATHQQRCGQEVTQLDLPVFVSPGGKWITIKSMDSNYVATSQGQISVIRHRIQLVYAAFAIVVAAALAAKRRLS
jgi:hypothetical protein